MKILFQIVICIDLNYSTNTVKMDNSFQDICLRWARSLNLCPVLDLISLIDGKIFKVFFKKILMKKNALNHFETSTEKYKTISGLM